MSKKAKTPVRRLFWDIETSPNIALTWRTGYKLSIPPENILRERGIICICYKWAGERKVHSLEWDNGDDRKMLEDFTEVANEADELVAHNGDKFDLRWFQGRRLINNLEPIPEYKTVDTLTIARRRFLLNSNKLDYIAKLLGFGGKSKTNFQWWRDILIDNCPTAMSKMVKYCKRDVRVLEQVYDRLSVYHNPKTHAGANIDLARWTCPTCGGIHVYQNKRIVSTAGISRYEMKCNDCGKYYRISQSVRDQYIEDRTMSEHKEKSA